MSDFDTWLAQAFDTGGTWDGSAVPDEHKDALKGHIETWSKPEDAPDPGSGLLKYAQAYDGSPGDPRAHLVNADGAATVGNLGEDSSESFTEDSYSYS